MNAPPPLPCLWNGEVFVPRYPRIADRHYVVGEVYPLVPNEERSRKSHDQEFAWLHDAWRNLPEDIADLYPTEEHLRKRALIEAGYYNEQIIDVGSGAGAIRVAAGVRLREEFSLVIARGPIVIIRTAKSQSRRAMKKKEFQESKTAIMQIVADLIGVEVQTLMSQSAPPTAPNDEPAIADCQGERA